MEYKIEKEKIPIVAGKKVLKIILMIILFMSLLLFWLSQNLNPGKSIIPILSNAFPKIILILLFVFFALFYRFQNYFKSIVFSVTNDSISQHISRDDLSLVNKFAADRNKSRYGSEHNQFIHYAHVLSISIKSNRIKIKSISYNFFNGNGTIVIPKETKDFDKLTIHFQKLKEQLKNKN